MKEEGKRGEAINSCLPNTVITIDPSENQALVETVGVLRTGINGVLDGLNRLTFHGNIQERGREILLNAGEVNRLTIK